MIIQLWKKPNFISTLNPIEINILEGYYKGELKIGDIVGVSNNEWGNYIVSRSIVKVIERRDYKGIFENPEDKINSYYKIEVK